MENKYLNYSGLQHLWGKIKSFVSDNYLPINGNASTATKLKTARKINGVSFDGSADITIPRSTLSLHTARGTVGSTGYVKIATFTISSAYRNSVVTVEFTRRGYIPVVLYIRWANVNGTDPDLEYFRFVHPTSMTNNAFMHKSDTSTWDLYIKKSGIVTQCIHPRSLYTFQV